MVVSSKVIEIGILVFSLAIGLIFFYLISDLTKLEKKKQAEELISQFVNLVIFIWLGKVIFNLSLFITDPLAVLAFPSDSKSFYLAIIFVSFVVLYQSKRKKINGLQFLEAFTYTFLIGSFIYEFIQFIQNDNTLNYLILLSVLIVLLLFLPKFVSVEKVLIIIITTWCIGIFILLAVQPYVTVFGYMMKLSFVAAIFAFCVVAYLYRLRKGN